MTPAPQSVNIIDNVGIMQARFRQVVADQSKRLYAHIRSIVSNHDDTDDVLQNTYMKAWLYLDRYRDEAGLQTWLFRIATNEALQHLRKQRIRKIFLLTERTKAEPVVNANDLNDSEAIKRKLHEAMKRLTVKQRMVFGMKYYNDMKYNEMAKILKVSEGTLKAVYHTATKKIETYLTENV